MMIVGISGFLLTSCASDRGVSDETSLPLQVGGYSLVPSGLMTELSTLSEGYGHRNWVFGAYGDDEQLRYRIVASVTDGPSLEGIDRGEFRDGIPAEGLFAIEGGFDMEWSEATSLTVEGDTRLTCSPGFAGDNMEVQVARGFYRENGWDESIHWDLVSAMCFFDNATHVGFIKSDTGDSIDDLMAIAQGITLELAG